MAAADQRRIELRQKQRAEKKMTDAQIAQADIEFALLHKRVDEQRLLNEQICARAADMCGQLQKEWNSELKVIDQQTAAAADECASLQVPS